MYLPIILDTKYRVRVHLPGTPPNNTIHVANQIMGLNSEYVKMKSIIFVNPDYIGYCTIEWHVYIYIYIYITELQV